MKARPSDSSILNFDYKWFIKKVQELTALNLNYYKRQQMERRINYLMSQNNEVSYQRYLGILKSSPEKLKEFVDWVTINVSEFFRDVDRWQLLMDEIMPSLLKRFRRLRIWSAGCSNGAEPYSLAIVLSELGSVGHYILATDIDDKNLEKAEKGIYKEGDLKSLPKNLSAKYFHQNRLNKRNEKIFELKPGIKRMVKFKKHNLFLNDFEKGFHLIVCRNVVIYFTNEAKDELYSKFSSVLVPGGLFFVGATESILNCKKFNLFRMHTAFYCKEGDSPL